MREIYRSSDSISAKFSKSSHFKSRAGTLYKTRMQTTYRNLESHAKKSRWGSVDPASITEKQIRGFVKARIEAGTSARTVQNEMTHLRRALEGVGRTEFAQVACANSAIGVPSASRIGTGKVIDESVLANAREQAPADTKALIDLQRSLGLRVREAVRCDASLKEWGKALDAGQQSIVVRDGTKGGKIRTVFIRPDNIETVRDAIRDAQAVVKGQGRLVVSANLTAALEQHTDRLARIGIEGENSSHSLRRAFALDQFVFYQAQGLGDKEALVRVSHDLGHGPSRGRWVYNNYLRGTLEKEGDE